jgi:hypothetical protein
MLTLCKVWQSGLAESTDASIPFTNVDNILVQRLIFYFIAIKVVWMLLLD